MGKLIDADALIEKCGDWYTEEGTEEGFIGTVKQLLELQPEAVIRCKDCKYCKTYDDIPWCNRLTGTFKVEEESFCSWGKENR